MKFTSVLVAVASIATAVNGTAIADSLTAIGAAATRFDNILNTYKGGLSSEQLHIAVNLQRNAIYLANNLTSAIATANSSPKLSSNDIGPLTTAFSSVQKIVPKILTTVVQKKQLFVNLGIKSTVLTDLQQEESNTKTLVAAIKAKVPSQFASAVTSLSAPLIKDFDSAIAKLS